MDKNGRDCSLLNIYRFVWTVFVARLSEGCLAASPGVARSGALAPRLGASFSLCLSAAVVVDALAFRFSAKSLGVVFVSVIGRVLLGWAKLLCPPRASTTFFSIGRE